MGRTTVRVGMSDALEFIAAKTPLCENAAPKTLSLRSPCSASFALPMSFPAGDDLVDSRSHTLPCTPWQQVAARHQIATPHPGCKAVPTSRPLEGAVTAIPAAECTASRWAGA